jgi:hypothetical protein
MRYTKRTIIVSQSRVSEAEERVTRQRKIVEKLESARHPADDAVALLRVMEQSLLSMRRFIATLERDLERSLGIGEKPHRTKVARRQDEARTDRIAREVVDLLRDRGIDAEQAEVPAPSSSTSPGPSQKIIQR